MTEEYDRIEDNRNIREAESEWDSAIEFGRHSTMHRLIDALVTEYDRIDDDLEEIYEQQHINSATGEELNQFGNLVNVDRKSGEGNDKYRARIKASFRASTIGTTYDEYVQFCAAVLNTNIDNLNFRTSYGAEPATVRVGAPSAVYNDLAITDTEVERLLGKGVPAGHEVRALEGGTFRLKVDGENDTAEDGLTSDSISTGGTLAADLV